MTHIWVTRSQPGASRFAQSLHKAGLTVTLEPLIKVVSLQIETPVVHSDLAVFLSQNAARLADLEQLRVNRVVAIGKGTKRELEKRGLRCIGTPDIASSEGLLTWVAEKGWLGQSVLIVTGRGGRKHLRDRWLEAGLTVSEWEVYSREKVRVQSNRLASVDAIEISSSAALSSLIRNLHDNRECVLQDACLLVPSRRIGSEALKAGFREIHVTRNATASGFIQLLRQFK